MQITLDQDKIDEVNDKLLVKVSDRLAEAKKQLDENRGQDQGRSGRAGRVPRAQLDCGKSPAEHPKVQSLTQQLRDAITQLDDQIPTLEQSRSPT